MRKSVRVAVVVGALAAAVGGAIIAEAQTGARKRRRAQGRDALAGPRRGRAAADPAQRAAVEPADRGHGDDHPAADLSADPALFPEGSGAGPGIETRALPAIWQNRQAFEAAAAGLNTAAGQLLQLAQANQEAAFRAAFPSIGQACGTCHTPFRAPQ